MTRAERIAQLAAATSAVDASWLIKSPDFANADERFSAWTITLPMDGSGSAREGDGSPSYSCNRILRVSKARGGSVLQTIEGVPNGYYALSAQGAYSPSAFELGPTNRRNWETGNMEIIAHLYMNGQTIDLPSIYSESKLASESGFQKSVNGKDGEPTKYFPGGINQISRDIFEGYYKTGTIIVNVTDGTLTLGVKVDNKEIDGQGREWFVVDNFKLTYYGDLGAALSDAIAQGKAFTGNTTQALSDALANAISAGEAALSSSDPNEIIAAAEAITSALAAAQAVDVTLLQATIAKAEADGVTIPSSVTDFLANGTSNEIEQHLRHVRNLRKLNAIDKVDISQITCSEPANEEADYYLYNVGAGIFFNTTADWGTHIAIDNPGMLIHFTPDGEWSDAPGRPVFHLSGNGWDGMNWDEEYWDKNGENKLAFVPVEGKEKVFYMCEWDNYNWHFVYDPSDDVSDQNTHYWNAVQKRNWNVDEYKNNPYAQWMLVSPEAYKAAMANASETKPLDVTFLINNPNFTKAKVDGNDNWTRGWTGVGGQMRGENREPWMVIEWFERDADMSQTIEGLAPGKYEVSCYGFYRDGSSDHEAGKVKNGETLIQNAFLTVSAKTDVEVALPNVTSEAGNMPGIGENRDGVSGKFACWPWEANQYFQTGLYKVTTPVVEVGLDGKLTIGIKSTYNGETGSWVVVGNFRLTSLGARKSITLDEDATTIPAAADNANVTLNRAFKQGWNAVVLPFDAEAFDGAQIAEFDTETSDTDNNITVTFKKADSFKANVPYLVNFPTAVAAGKVFEGVKFEPAEVKVEGGTYFNFVGTYTAGEVVKAGDYVISGGQLKKASAAINLKGTRSFFQAKTSNARSLTLTFDDGEISTGIETIGNAQKANDNYYNLNGQRVEKTSKGLYIKEGKKVVIK